MLNGEPMQETTLTEKLVEMAQYMNETEDIISDIAEKLRGPEPCKDCCEKAPWPPQIGISQWIADNQRSAERIRTKLRDIARAL